MFPAWFLIRVFLATIVGIFFYASGKQNYMYFGAVLYFIFFILTFEKFSKEKENDLYSKLVGFYFLLIPIAPFILELFGIYFSLP